MNKELKEKWIKALRSGEYKQGKGALRISDNHFCCLGVYCHILDPSRWVYDSFTRRWEYRDKSTFVPGEFFFPNASQDVLVTMNDKGKSFEEIADYIEANINV